MNKFLSFLCLYAFMFSSLVVFSADTPPITITQNFKNSSVRLVLQTVEKVAKCKIVYNPSEVNVKNIISREFKEASPISVIRAAVGKNFTVTKKGNVYTIRPKVPIEDQPISATSQKQPNQTQPKTVTTPAKVSSTPNKTPTSQDKKVPQTVTITKKFKNTPLFNVLQFIEKKADYRIKYDKSLDIQQNVSHDFKNANPVVAIRTAVGESYAVSKKDNVVTIKLKAGKKPSPASSVKKSDAPVKEKGKSAIQKDSVGTDSLSRKGHYLQAFIGLGYGDAYLTLKKNNYTNEKSGNSVGNFGGLVQLQYAYYFHEHWGITAGLGFGNYFATTKLNTANKWEGVEDSESDTYEHITKTKDWKEREMVYMLDFPIGIQLQYPINAKGTSIYAGTGIRIGLPVSNKYKLMNGSIEHEGYYSNTNATLSHLNSHDFYTETIGNDFDKTKHSIDLKPVSIAVMADIGFLFPVCQHVDLMFGAYFHISCNDMKNKTTELGWQQKNAAPEYKKHPFMNEYAGVVASEFTKNVHPFQVGIKFGVNWHIVKNKQHPAPIEEPKPEPKPEPEVKKEEPKPTPAPIIVPKPIVNTEPKVVVEEPEPMVAIRKLTSTSVIWFDLGSTVPKLQPADIINRLAEILKENPNQKILINGHASKDGNEEFNRKLSEKRAQAVYDLFIKAGVAPKQMKTQGLSIYVDYKDKNTNRSQHNISLDRRVEIIPVTDFNDVKK